MNIKVLGTGCTNCKTLEARTAEALETIGIDADIEKVTDSAEIAAWGVMSTPALVVGDHVVLMGRVPNVADLERLLLATFTPK